MKRNIDDIIIEKIKKKYHYTDKFIYSLPEKELNFIIETFKTETIYERNNENINDIVILFDDYDASYIWKYRTEYEENYKCDNRYILLKYISSCKVKELNKIIKQCEIENRTHFVEFDDIKYNFLTKAFNYKKNDIFSISKGFNILKVKYFYDRYKNNGKVIMLSGRESAKRERRKLRKLKTKYLKNEISKTEILNLFLSWSGNILKSFNAYNLYKQNYIYFKKLIF